MIKRLPWLRSRKKTDPEVPLRLPIACGPDSARTRLIRKLVNEKAEEVSRREGIDRREFMASACGMATTLYMINLVNGCASHHQADNRLGMSGRDGGDGDDMNGAAGRKASGESGSTSSARHDAGGGMDAGGRAGRSGGSGTGGYTGITDAAMEDPIDAMCALGDGGNELIIDMQTHFVSSNLPLGVNGMSPIIGQITEERYPWITRTPGCEKAGTCYGQQEYVDQIFMNSDTTISVLSGVPYSLGADGTNAGGFAVATNEDVLTAAMELNAAFPNRVLTQCSVMPNDRVDLQLAMMEKNAGLYDNWSTSPSWSPNENGYWLDRDVGPQMLQKGLDLNRPIFSIQKGVPLNGLSSTYTNPKDVGPAALMFPNAYLVISHAAFEHGLASGDSTAPSLDDPMADMGWGPGVGQWPEGPYDESLEALGDDQPTDKGTYPLNRGVNSLIKSLRDAGIAPNGLRPDGQYAPHVYADCSWAWASLMTGRVEEAMHYWGKLMKYVGEDCLLWGTDCLWFGCPQPLIQAFRAFEISQEFQDKYGYPALTQSRKEKILGQNAARLQNVVTTRIDPIVGCHSTFVGNEFLKRKRDLDTEFGVRRDMIRNVAGPRTRRHFLRLRGTLS